MSDIVVRRATEADFDALLTLFEDVAAERKWIATEPGFDKEKYCSAWRRTARGEDGVQFVACDGNEVAGELSIRIGKDGDRDVGMLVKETHRGRGIGTLLLRAALNWAAQNGVTRLQLGVFPHNAAAIHLYKKMGFAEAARLERKIARQSGERWDVIIMRREISEPVVLAAYDPRWTSIFENESRRLHDLLRPFGLKALEHVGSTSIPGMTAKPVIDIVAGVTDVNDVPASDDAIWSSAGFECGHGADQPGDWKYFIKRDASGHRIVHLHVVPFGGPFWTRIIAFRDALREDPNLAAAYEALKRSLAEKYAQDRLQYLDGKAAFVNDVVCKRLSVENAARQ